MKLYGSYTSPFVRHVRIALQQTGTAFEFVETDQVASASKSPTKRVPFLEDGDLFLTDSASIIRHIREKASSTFLPNVMDLDFYCLVNTALETTVNLFYLLKEGMSLESSTYLQRQQARIGSALTELEARVTSLDNELSDPAIRLACFIGWAIYRNRIDFTPYPQLMAFYQSVENHPLFTSTAPPALS